MTQPLESSFFKKQVSCECFQDCWSSGLQVCSLFYLLFQSKYLFFNSRLSGSVNNTSEQMGQLRIDWLAMITSRIRDSLFIYHRFIMIYISFIFPHNSRPVTQQ